MKTIVLITQGKHEDVDHIAVKLFDDRSEAEKFCAVNTDDPKDKKYWRFSAIVEEGKVYEVIRYRNSLR